MLQNIKYIRYILGIFLLLSLATLITLPLGLDEAYYWYWAKHPDFSYLDHPPMIAWLIASVTNLGDDRELFVRLGGFFLLWSGLAAGHATVRVLFPKAPAWLAWEYLLILNLTIIIAGATIIQTPDTPLFALWIYALYYGARVVTNQEPQAWYGLGIALGLGLLSKYTMVLFVPCLVLFFLLSPAHRHWFIRREPWLAAMLAVLIWMPVLWWNWQHDWISFNFQLRQGFEVDTTSWLARLVNYIGGQAAVISPLLWLAFVWYSLRRINSVLQDPVRLYLTLMSWPIILFFAWTSVYGAQAEANWPAPAYLAGLMLAWTELRYQNPTPQPPPPNRIGGVKMLALIITILSLVLNLSLRVHLLYPWLPIEPKLDRLHEFANWPNLGRQIRQIMDNHPHPDGWFLLSDRGTFLAEALYYTKRNLIGFDPTRPERYLFLGDINRQLVGKNAVILTQHSQAVAIKRFGPLFHRLTLISRYQHQYRNQIINDSGGDLYLGESFGKGRVGVLIPTE